MSNICLNYEMFTNAVIIRNPGRSREIPAAVISKVPKRFRAKIINFCGTLYYSGMKNRLSFPFVRYLIWGRPSAFTIEVRVAAKSGRPPWLTLYLTPYYFLGWILFHASLGTRTSRVSRPGLSFKVLRPAHALIY